MKSGGEGCQLIGCLVRPSDPLRGPEIRYVNEPHGRPVGHEVMVRNTGRSAYEVGKGRRPVGPEWLLPLSILGRGPVEGRSPTRADHTKRNVEHGVTIMTAAAVARGVIHALPDSGALSEPTFADGMMRTVQTFATAAAAYTTMQRGGDGGRAPTGVPSQNGAGNVVDELGIVVMLATAVTAIETSCRGIVHRMAEGCQRAGQAAVENKLVRTAAVAATALAGAALLIATGGAPVAAGFAVTPKQNNEI